ncbi:mRNA turnover protein 4 homolog [Ischnura elegans]|uniref:mRNA turnover protein 4 homolog n=1 Tax=Ischnura elegans TaxID=197161 RepID=UPI001ED8A417|nr:mRNA turnover protein 4 homolog [Ischnura elegans]
MPKSKRDQKVSLTKTTKKGFIKRKELAEEIRKNAEKYSCIFTFTVQGMRNDKLKDLRQEWRPSRFYFGKNKVMVYGLGKDPSSETQKNLHLLAKQLKGQCGLLFTDTPKKEVIEWFKDYHEISKTRAGDVATETVILKEGPCPKIVASQEDMMRKLGLPITLKRGVITLLSDFTVCEKGDILTPERSRILNILEMFMSEFRIHLGSVWTKDGKFEILNPGKESKPASIGRANEPEEVEMEDESSNSADDDVECDE